MSRIIVLTALCAFVATPGWTAQREGSARDADTAKHQRRDRDEESLGVGSGVVVGSILGGPVGAVIGAALGGWVGDKFHRERKAREDFASRYEDASAEASSLAAMLDGSERDLAELRNRLERREDDFQAALNEALNLEVFFHTGEATLDSRAQARLTRLGGVLRDVDDFTVVIEGHADARGDETYNEQLSAARAATVRDVLIEGGLPAERITVSAAGERDSTADEKDLDSLALERRVNLSVVAPEPRQRVARQ